MVQGRREILQELEDTIERVINLIEERESVEPDFAIVRELAEQLGEEIEALQS